MDCCYLGHDECDTYSVTPVLVAEDRTLRCCEEAPEFCPRLPPCKGPVTYCCKKKPDAVLYCDEKKPQKIMYCCEKKPKKVMYCYEEKPQKVYCCVKEPPSEKCCMVVKNECQQSKKSSCKTSEPKQELVSCKSCCNSDSKPIKTKYIMPCYRYEDGRIVRSLPVTAFKRNGLQDQDHSKTLGTTNFLVRCPRDVAVECDVHINNIKVADPAKVPTYKKICSAPTCRSKPIKKNQPTVLMRRACEVAYGPSRQKPFISSSYHADQDHEIRRFHSEDDKGNCCYHFERNKAEPCYEPPACFPDPCRPIGACVSSPGCEYVQCKTVNSSENPSCCYYCT